MKKMTILAAFMGLALVFGTASKSEAFCLIFCGGDDTEVATVEIDDSTVSDSSVIAGDGNTTATNLRNSVVIGDDVNTRQSNFMGAVGFNKGDLSQSNSANITGQQNIRDNDMRDFSTGRNR